MAKIITLGEYNKQYKYIWFLVLSRFLYTYIFSYSTIPLTFKPKFLTLKSLPTSVLAKDFIDYLVMFICSFLLLIYEKWRLKKDIKKPYDIENILTNKAIKSPLIYNNILSKVKINSAFFIYEILLVFQGILINNYYNIGLSGIDFWIFELIFISLINTMLFKSQIYRHQKLAIYFIIISCSLLYFLSIIDIFKNEQDDKIYKTYIWITPIAIIGFILTIFLKSYSYCKSKYYFDLKYISVFRFLMFLGIIGAIICLIATIISSSFSCDNNFKYVNSVCRLYYSPEKNVRYYDNIKILFKELYKLKGAYILIFFLRSINYFFTTLFTFLIIKYLSPEYTVISNSIYYFILEIFRLINFFIKHEYQYFSIYTILSELFSIIGAAIYLEFIELNFFNLNLDLKRNISNRSRTESFQELTPANPNDDDDD